MGTRELSETLDQLERLQPRVDPSARNVFEGRGEVAEDLCRELRAQVRKGRSMVLFIDGLPGSGKSGMSRRIISRVQEEEILEPEQIAEIPLDLFIGTERGSEERAHLTDSRETFAANYMRYNDARTAVAGVLGMMAEKKSGEINFPRTYDRTQGGIFAPHDFSVNDDTRLLVVEGTGAINNVAGYNGIPRGIHPASAWISTGVRQGLLGGTLRDVSDGRANPDFREIYFKRMQEYAYLVPSVRESVRRASKICLRYPKRDSFDLRLLRLQSDVDEGRADTRMSVARNLADLDPEFLRAIYPGNIPSSLYQNPQSGGRVMAA